MPSWAVTTIVIVFEPTFSEIEPEAEPEVTVVPLTLMLAEVSVRVGVTVIEVTLFATEAKYEVVAEAKVGDNVPSEVVSTDRVATAEAARVTVIV